MQQHIQQVIVNAVEDEGFHRSSEVNIVIERVAETLATALDEAVKQFLSEVGEYDSSLEKQARDLFVNVGLAEPEVDEVDEEQARRNEVYAKAEVYAKVEALVEEARALLASV